jgi:hypothetical protein
LKELRTIFTKPFKGIDLNKLLEAAMDKNEERILDLNRHQLDQGIDAKGKSLGKYANFKYKGRWEPVDLKLTGDYRKKKTLSKSKGKRQAEMFSQDQKAAKLEKRYGKDIEGLTFENTNIAGDIIKPDLQEGFRKEVMK